VKQLEVKQLSSFGNGKLFSKLLVFAEVDAGLDCAMAVFALF
jgi:hypothetical protein